MRSLKCNISIILFLFFRLILRSQTPVETSQQVFNYLKSKNYDKLDAIFDTTGILKLITSIEKTHYKSDLESFGKLKTLIRIDEEPHGFKIKTALTLEFKRVKKTLIIVFNQRNKVESFSFMDFTETPFFQLKGYNGFSEVTDLSTQVHTRDGLVLGANIAFGDTNKQKSPLVIFVHGSGPNDRDETIGPNKPFRDLAQGLAQKGIVSLRYDKRTFTYQFDAKLKSDSMTLFEETINDALDAIKVAKQFTFIDTAKIYIVGHSQGAMCAPMIATLSQKVKGIVMMASPARNMVDILPEQVEYLALLDDTVSNAEQMQITSVKWMVNKIKSPNLSNKTPHAALWGASAVYWKSVLNYHQLDTSKKLTLPILILNGERDYQVTMKEYDIWKEALKKNHNVTLISYPKLNHLFTEGVGKPNPKEYNVPNHIPQYVIDDIVNFVLEKK